MADEYGADLVTVLDDEGNQHQFELVDAIETDDGRYVALLPVYEDPSESVNDDGELIIKGKSTKNFKEREWDAYRNNSVGFVFQSYNLITHLSIVTNVELGMTLSGVSREEKHRRAVEVLEQVGLKEHLHKKPNQLSGGQMQRVAIARALANDPEILLCDEPTGALDYVTGKQILKLLQDTCRQKGVTVVVITHNSAITPMADRVIHIKNGTVESMQCNEHPTSVELIEW